MRKLLGVTLAALLALVLAGPALALELSADVVRKGMGPEHTSRIFMKDKMIRLEGVAGPMGPGYNILRQDKKVMWIVNPGQKMYFEVPLDGLTDVSQQAQSGGRLPGEVSRKELGGEKVDGHPTTKYLITYQAGGQTHSIHQWMAKDLELPIKTADVDGAWSVEYRNIKKGPQPDGLFEVPGDFQKTSLAGLGNMMRQGRQGQGRQGQGMGPGMGRPPQDR